MVNQAKAEAKVLSIDFASNEPTVLKNFVQTFDCPIEDRYGKPVANEHVLVELTSGDTKSAHAEIISVENFGNAEPHGFDLAETERSRKSDWDVELAGVDSQKNGVRLSFSRVDLGWASPESTLSFDVTHADGSEPFRRFTRCTTSSVKPL